MISPPQVGRMDDLYDCMWATVRCGPTLISTPSKRPSTPLTLRLQLCGGGGGAERGRAGSLQPPTLCIAVGAGHNLAQSDQLEVT